MLPTILLFDNCSLRQSRSSFWLALSLVFLLSPPWLHLAFLTILILIACSLVTLWCTWLWCGLRDGGNYHRVGGGMPLSLHLLHGDKPQPRVQQENSILHSLHSTPTITHCSELCIWGLFKLIETYLNFKFTNPAVPARASLGVRTDGMGWIFCNLGTKRSILSPLMKKWTRKGSIFPAAVCRFVVYCSLLGMWLLWIEMNSPFTFTPTTTSTTYISQRGEVYAANNSEEENPQPCRANSSYALLHFSLQSKISARFIWQILLNWLPFLGSVWWMSTTKADVKRLTLQINLYEIKISCLLLILFFSTWHILCG